MAKSLNNLGEVLVDVGLADSANACFGQSYAICQKLGYTKGMIKSIQNRGVVFGKHGQTKLAVSDFNNALQLSQQIGYDKGTLDAHLQLARVSLSLADHKRAEGHATLGLALALEKNVLTNARDFYQILSDIKALQAKYRQSLEFYKKYAQAKDEILNLETNQKIAELEAHYEIDINQRENTLLKQDNQIKTLQLKQQSSLIISISVIFVFAGNHSGNYL
ncbi:MAG: hypothetical protein HC896_17825 [Bacteroidales bacterium]|nr:hypothetical protein [Bacteroidales bacterium]